MTEPQHQDDAKEAHLVEAVRERASRPTLAPSLLRELHRVDHRHGSRITAFALLYAASAFGAWRLSPSIAHNGWLSLAALPLYLLAAASLHGLSLFTHEGVHRTLSASPAKNAALSVLCGLPVLHNFMAYRVLHLEHHRNLGREGDPDHYPNYSRWTWVVFAMNWTRLLAGSLIYTVAIPVLGYRKATRSERAAIAGEAAAAAAVVALLVFAPLPKGLVLHGWLIPVAVISAIVNVRGMSQHTLLPHADDPVLGSRSIRAGKLVSFFMCNENYHLEHHLYPGVPWYNLERLSRALDQELAARGAQTLPSYSAFVREFVVASVRRSPLGWRGGDA